MAPLSDEPKPPAADAPPPVTDPGHRAEIVIANTLTAGVCTAVVVILTGFILTFVHHPEYRTTGVPMSRLVGAAATDFPTSLPAIWAGVCQFQGRSIVALGLMILIATPIFRVAASILVFAAQRDWRFVWITLAVLTLLAISFFLGKVE